MSQKEVKVLSQTFLKFSRSKGINSTESQTLLKLSQLFLFKGLESEQTQSIIKTKVHTKQRMKIKSLLKQWGLTLQTSQVDIPPELKNYQQEYYIEDEHVRKIAELIPLGKFQKAYEIIVETYENEDDQEEDKRGRKEKLLAIFQKKPNKLNKQIQNTKQQKTSQRPPSRTITKMSQVNKRNKTVTTQQKLHEEEIIKSSRDRTPKDSSYSVHEDKSQFLQGLKYPNLDQSISDHSSQTNPGLKPVIIIFIHSQQRPQHRINHKQLNFFQIKQDHDKFTCQIGVLESSQNSKWQHEHQQKGNWYRTNTKTQDISVGKNSVYWYNQFEKRNNVHDSNLQFVAFLAAICVLNQIQNLSNVQLSQVLIQLNLTNQKIHFFLRTIDAFQLQGEIFHKHLIKNFPKIFPHLPDSINSEQNFSQLSAHVLFKNTEFDHNYTQHKLDSLPKRELYSLFLFTLLQIKKKKSEWRNLLTLNLKCLRILLTGDRFGENLMGKFLELRLTEVDYRQKVILEQIKRQKNISYCQMFDLEILCMDFHPNLLEVLQILHKYVQKRSQSSEPHLKILPESITKVSNLIQRQPVRKQHISLILKLHRIFKNLQPKADNQTLTLSHFVEQFLVSKLGEVLCQRGGEASDMGVEVIKEMLWGSGEIENKILGDILFENLWDQRKFLEILENVLLEIDSQRCQNLLNVIQSRINTDHTHKFRPAKMISIYSMIWQQHNQKSIRQSLSALAKLHLNRYRPTQIYDLIPSILSSQQNEIQDLQLRCLYDIVRPKSYREKEAISKQIRQKYLNQLGQKFFQEFLAVLSQNQGKFMQEIQKKVFLALTKQSKDIKKLSIRHSVEFRGCLSRVQERIKNRKILFEDLKTIFMIPEDIVKQFRLEDLIRTSQETKQIFEKTHRNYQSLTTLITSYSTLFPQQSAQISQMFQSLYTKQISEWTDQKYHQYAKSGHKLYLLSKIGEWKKQNIKQLGDLWVEGDRVEKYVGEVVEMFGDGILGFGEFRRLFRDENKDLILACTEDDTTREKIIRFMTELSQQNICHLTNLLQALDYFQQAINKSPKTNQSQYRRSIKLLEQRFGLPQPEPEPEPEPQQKQQTQKKQKNTDTNTIKWTGEDLKMLEEIEMSANDNSNEKKEILVDNLYQSYEEAKNIIESVVGVEEKKWGTDEIVKVLEVWKEVKHVFARIQANKVDENMIEDLKEYINDVENSLLKTQTIILFKQILEFYHQTIPTTSTVSSIIPISSINSFSFQKPLPTYFQTLRAQILQKQWILHIAISNISSHMSMIQQKIDQVKNREISFKYQVEEILMKSEFRVGIGKEGKVGKEGEDGVWYQLRVLKREEKTKKNTELRSQIKKNIMVEESKREDNNRIEMKKLRNYKDRSLLLVTDFSRQQHQLQTDQTTKKIIQLLNSFLKILSTIQKIQTSLSQLSSLGYPQSKILQINNREIIIYNGKSKSLDQLCSQLNQDRNEWGKQIKLLYSSSYVLTHFVGSELSKMVEGTIRGEYFQEIQGLFEIERNDFSRKLPKMWPSTPLQRIKQVANFYNQLWKNPNQSTPNLSINSSELSIIHPQKPQKNLQQITCKQSQFYFYLTESGQIPSINQILYCQQQTSLQQIDCFLKRSMIAHHRKHYVIGVHWLELEKQQKFCDLLNRYWAEDRDRFGSAKLVFIDCSTLEKVYVHLGRTQMFMTSKRSSLGSDTSKTSYKKFIKLLGKTTIISSLKPGEGKTYQAQKLAKKHHPSGKIHHFPVCGNISFHRLSQRLRDLPIKQNSTLLIQIGHVENKQKLEVFLSQLIIFKCFNFHKFYFLPNNTQIIIELQNVLDLSSSTLPSLKPVSKISKQINEIHIPEQYHILKIMQEEGTQYREIKGFSLEELDIDEEDLKGNFVILYLHYLETKQLNSNQKISFTQYKTQPNRQQLPLATKKSLLKTYYLSQTKSPSYRHCKYFLSMLFQTLQTFSESIYFNVKILEQDHRTNRHIRLNQVREAFVRICIRNSLEFLEEGVNTNQFQGNYVNGKADFRKKLDQFPFLVLPNYQKDGFQFVYLNDEQVDFPIKSLKLTQQTDPQIRRIMLQLRKQSDITQTFHRTALNVLQNEHLQLQIFTFLQRLSNNSQLNSQKYKTKKSLPSDILQQMKRLQPALSAYSITLDNFFKMCLIIQRMICGIPIVIMGESGVGKTALIRFLTNVVFKHPFLCFNVHAGVNQEILIKWHHQILDTVRAYEKEGSRCKIWVFFDEFNTTDELSYIKEMIIDRRFQGQQYPPNVVFLAACNPYRRLQTPKFQTPGLKLKPKKASQSLAFKVKPPPLSMITIMWDYQQLNKRENLKYIEKMIDQIRYENLGKLVETLGMIHEYFKENYQISSASLRDVSRFRDICSWFYKVLKDRSNKPMSNQNKNMGGISIKTRSVLLAITFCYGMRIPDPTNRLHLFALSQKTLSLPPQSLINTFTDQQIYYSKELHLSTDKNIAINRALKQNIFVALVCLMNKIPVLIVGNPGNSKSLAIRMLEMNLKGLNSRSQMCQQFQEFNMVYFQGSETCTSKGVEQIFQKVKKSQEEFDKKQKERGSKLRTQNCIYFDQIGLAQKSAHNPLKVLHAQLQTQNKQICFIGVSNWQLDASKMSRFLTLIRQSPTEQQLQQTSIGILQNYHSESSPAIMQKFKKLATYYYRFINEWNSNPENICNFFGLRDFYSYVKFICTNMEKNCNDGEIQKLVVKSIAINFDGQPKSLGYFYNIAGIREVERSRISPIELVRSNLGNQTSRCLLLILRGDALVPLINQSITVNGEQRRVVCMYGSTFDQDQSSEEYNLQMTSKVISHISRGNILAFKDINNSIQTSLYDLFNKSFYEVGPKKYCRIAVGANSNPKCLVHNDFNAIVYIEEANLRNTDLAFLNRFQKHYLNLNSMLEEDEYNYVTTIQEWLDSIFLPLLKKTPLKKQNFLINSSQESIVSLVIKHRSIKNQSQKIFQIKSDLLWNMTLDFKLALKNNYLDKKIVEEIVAIYGRNFGGTGRREENMMEMRETGHMDNNENNMKNDQILCWSKQKISFLSEQKQDLLIYTYDQNLDSSNNYTFFVQNHSYKFRISSIKREKDLEKQLESTLLNPTIKNIHIIINYQREHQHINLLLFLCKNLRNQHGRDKKLFVVIQLLRSSFASGKIETVNISYLHGFKQIFVEDLAIKNNTEQVVKSTTMLQIFEHLSLNTPDDFPQTYLQALQKFQFTTPHNLFPVARQLDQNQRFQTLCLTKIHEKAKKQNVQFLFLLQNKEEDLFSYSVGEAVMKYAMDFLVGRLVGMTKVALEFGFVFGCFLEGRGAWVEGSQAEDIEQNNYFDLEFTGKKFSINQDSNYKLDTISESHQILLKLSKLNSLKINYSSLLDNSQQFLDNKFNTSHKNITNQINTNRVSCQDVSLFPIMGDLLAQVRDKAEDKIMGLIQRGYQIYRKGREIQGQERKQERFQLENILRKAVETFQNVFWVYQNESAKRLLKQQPQFQILIIFDILRQAHFNQNLLTEQKLFIFSKLFYKIYSSRPLYQKILITISNKKLTSLIFNYFITINENQLDFDTLSKFFQLYGKKCEENHAIHQILHLTKYIVETHQQRYLLTFENASKLGYGKYLLKFEETYRYILQMRKQCSQSNLQVSSKLVLSKKVLKLFEFLAIQEEKMNKKSRNKIKMGDSKVQIEQLLEQYLLFIVNQRENYNWNIIESQNQREEILLLSINNFVQEYRKQQITPQSHQKLDEFLSFQIFPTWLQKLLQSPQKPQESLQTCLQQFIALCDKSTYFANKSFYFFQTLFDKFIDLPYQQKQQYILESSEELEIIQEYLGENGMNTGFAVALGNFINVQVSFALQQGVGEIGDMEKEAAILNRFFEDFRNKNKQMIGNTVAQIFNLQFCKIYLSCYLHYLPKSDLSPTVEQSLNNIDGQLCIQTPLLLHLRLYAFKLLLKAQNSNLPQIKQKYLDIHRCRWIEMCREYVESQEVVILRPRGTVGGGDVRKIIGKFQDGDFRDTKLLNQLYLESFKSPYAKYQVLSMLATEIYPGVCLEQQVKQIHYQLRSRGDLSLPQNNLQKSLVLSYCDHRLNPTLSFNPKQKNLPEYIHTQLPQLSIINLFISCRFVKCPLIEMFFDFKTGDVPKDYGAWLGERFLVGGRQNLSVKTIGIAIQNGEYKKFNVCSNQCDYIYLIGNCQKPDSETNCPWCGKTIGGMGHKHAREAQGARAVQRPQMQAQLSIFRQKKSTKIQQKILRFTGYTLGKSCPQMLQSLSTNDRLHPITIQFLTYTITTMWLYLITPPSKQKPPTLPVKQIENIFGMNMETAVRELGLFQRDLGRKLREGLGLDGDRFTVWILGVLGLVLEYVVKFQERNSGHKKGEPTLRSAFWRDQMQKQLQALIMKQTGGLEKQLLLATNTPKTASINPNSNLVHQRGNPTHNHTRFPLLRLIKICQYPSYTHFLLNQRQKIKVTHPALSYLLENVREFQEMGNDGVIFQFVGKLVEVVRLRVERRDAERRGVGFVVERVWGDGRGKEKEEFLRLYREFVNRWNEIADRRIRLSDGCNSLGFIQKIGNENYDEYPIINFLPDKQNPQNHAGFKALALLRHLAQTYNTHYQNLLSQIQKVPNIYLSPSTSTPQNQPKKVKLQNYQQQKHLLLSFRQSNITQKINISSSLSVEYGISTPIYDLDQIQASLMEGINGKKMMCENREEFGNVQFIGEMNLLIISLKTYFKNPQNLTEQQTKNLEIYLYQQKQRNPQKSQKYLNNLLGNIESVMFYCKNLKAPEHMKIGAFIRQGKLEHNSGELGKIDVFRELRLGQVISFYQVVQAKTFDQIQRRLDNCYKITELSQKQRERLTLCKKQISELHLQHLTKILHRFTIRWLYRKKIPQTQYLADWLPEQQLLPENETYPTEKLVNYFRLQLTKMYSILKMFPYQDRFQAQLNFVHQGAGARKEVVKKPETIEKDDRNNDKMRNKRVKRDD